MIDIGANLAHESFAADIPQVLERAWQAGLSHIVITGSSRASNQQAAQLAAIDAKRLSSTAGVHPHHASEWTMEDAALIRELAQQPQLVAVGECGLDYFRDLSPRAEQRHAFIAQLQLAVALQKPVFLHQRDAHSDFLPILREYRPHLPAACVHCFTDTQAALEDYLALDCYIGITGWVCDAKRGAPLQAVVPSIANERLLVETDAPYLLPHTLPKAQRPANARRNEPAFLPYVVQALAALRGSSALALAQQTASNAQRFFGLVA